MNSRKLNEEFIPFRLTHSGQEVDEAIDAIKYKVDKTDDADQIYGTDEDGNQTTYNKDDFGGGLVNDVKVDGVSVVTNKVANINLSGKVSISDIVDDLDSTATNKPLSANMGRELAEYTDASITDTMNFIIQERDAEKAAREAGDNLRYTKTESDVKFSLISETGNKIDLECDTTTYKLTAKLYDKNNNLISTSTVIDLPIESLVMSVEYVDTTDHPKSIKITLQNGTVTYVPVGAIVSGLAKQSDLDAVSSRVATIEGKEAGWDAKAELSDITAARVGLDKVPNVATNDQTPSYTEASTLATLTSGEKLSVAFGKIKKAISSLISHIGSTSNPHSVTKEQVGLGSVVNTGDSDTPTSGGTTKFTTGGAYAELAKKQNTITGAASVITTNNLSTSRALQSDSNGKVAVSTTTAAELEYVHGVTSNIQTQLNSLSARGTILYGTTEPSASLGKVGDIYVQY